MRKLVIHVACVGVAWWLWGILAAIAVAVLVWVILFVLGTVTRKKRFVDEMLMLAANHAKGKDIVARGGSIDDRLDSDNVLRDNDVLEVTVCRPNQDLSRDNLVDLELFVLRRVGTMPVAQSFTMAYSLADLPLSLVRANRTLEIWVGKGFNHEARGRRVWSPQERSE